MSFYNNRRVLVTGASGFIGSHLCRALLHQGAQVFGVSRSAEEREAREIHWLEADLAYLESTHQVLRRARPDVVVNLAGQVCGTRELESVVSMLQNTLLATVNVFTAAAAVGCARVVHAGSLEEPDPDGAPIPGSPYGAAKGAASAYAAMFRRLYGLDVGVARLFMTYGPAQADLTKLIPYVTLSALAGESPLISSGERRVGWIYVDDVFGGLMALGETGSLASATYELGSGELVSIRQVVQRLTELVDPAVRPLFGARGDRPYERIRAAQAARDLKWAPTIGLNEGLSRTVEWYREHAHDLRTLATESAR